MFKRKPREKQISKSRLLRAVKRKATVLGDLSRDKSHTSKAIMLEDIQRIVRETK